MNWNQNNGWTTPGNLKWLTIVFKDAKEKVLITFQPDLFQQLTFDEREKKKQMHMGNAPFGGSNA